jgi:hypothetical protein
MRTRTRALIAGVVVVALGGICLSPSADARLLLPQLAQPDGSIDSPSPPPGSDPWVPDGGGPPERIAPAPTIEAARPAPERTVSPWLLRLVRIFRILPVGGPVR